jgi:hypothetical protein
MYCSKCGAAVVGKYCSCCGARVRSAVEELRLAERRAKKLFVDDCYKRNYPQRELELMHLGSACWQACEMRYGKGARYNIGDEVPAEAFKSLETVREHAEKLFEKLMGF